MMLFALSLDGDTRDWYFSLTQGSITNWDQFNDAFTKRWAFELDGSMALDRFIAMAKTDKKSVKEFIQSFDNHLREIPDRLKPNNDSLKAVEGT